MKRTEEFFESLKIVKEQKSFLGPIFTNLFQRISIENFRNLVNHAIEHKEEYINKKYHYFEKSPIGSLTSSADFLYCSYEIYLNKYSELILNILTKSKSSDFEVDEQGRLISRKKINQLKSSGRDKNGSVSFLISARGIGFGFSTGSHGEGTIKDVLREGKITDCFHSAFIGELMVGEPLLKKHGKTTQAGLAIPRLSTCGQLALYDGHKINLKRLEDLSVAIKSFAFGLRAISNAKWVHQDIKLGNILLLVTGIIQIIDFGISTAEHQGTCNGTAGSLAPESLVEIVEAQRIALIEDCKHLLPEVTKNLNQLSLYPLRKQIAHINKVLKLLNITPTTRYNFHCIKHVYFNSLSILVWEDWQKRGKTPVISELKLPTRQQDMWSFGYVLYELIKNSQLTAEEKPYANELADYIKISILLAPPLTRIDIDMFLVKLDELIAKHPTGADPINLRISQHIQKYKDLQKSVVVRKENRKKRSSSVLPSLEEKGKKLHVEVQAKFIPKIQEDLNIPDNLSLFKNPDLKEIQSSSNYLLFTG